MSCKGIFTGVQAVQPSGYNIIETGNRFQGECTGVQGDR